MHPDDLKTLLEAGLEDCEISVTSDGGHYNILVIGDLFAGLRPVKKQQLVYAVLNPVIADGSVHAVNIRTFTPAEWQAQG